MAHPVAVTTPRARKTTTPRDSREPGGLGRDGTIPSDPNGVAAGHTGEPSTFEPEEDELSD